MPKIHRPSEEELAVGRALAERAGLNPAVTLEDYEAQPDGDTVRLIFEVVHTMPRTEYETIVAATKS